MRQVLRALTLLVALATGVLPVAAFDGPTQTKGGAKPAAAATDAKTKKSKAVTQAEKLLERGVTAYDAGNANQAIRAFNTAINSGSLAGTQMARALYYRGLAYAKRGMSGQAISDLTSAVWIKDGLSPVEKQAALQARQAAYRSAGISDVPQLNGVAAVANTAPITDTSGSWQTAMSGSAAPSAPAVSSSSPAITPPAALPVSQPAPAPQSSGSSSGGGITGFFNNLFGSGSSSSSQEAVTTSSIGNQPTAAPADSSWSQTTQIASVEEARAASSPPATAAPYAGTQVAAVPPPAAAPASPPGQYLVQIAALRSRSEAHALSVRLISQYGSQFGAHRPHIDEKVIGSMGTFYRVRVGPFESAEESRQLCGTLHAGGLDCLVVTQ
jgi:tetratricopeptide (TPR) repeat protein